MSLNVEEICSTLQGDDRHQKSSVFLELVRFCREKETHSEEELIRLFDDCYLHLLKCYSDRYESVRCDAVNTVTQFFKRFPPNDFHLLNIISTLAERMGQQETVEKSEELRLLYTIQLTDLVKHYVDFNSVRALETCYPQIERILEKAIRDAFPNVQREACICIETLGTAAEPHSLQQMVEQLTLPLYAMLKHKHSLSRSAAVKALCRVALHLKPGSEALPRLFMEVSPLLMDDVALVRLECGKLGTVMLMELKDRYSYFERIIPLVLCCLKDDIPQVVEFITPLWKECGQQYYEENEAELNKQEIADMQPKNYPSGVQRPTIGCRGIVQRSLRLLSLIFLETNDWRECVRLHSLKLLYQFVIHAEAAMTAKFFEIYPEMASACNDGDPKIAMEAYKVADVMGRLLRYEDWRDHAVTELETKSTLGFLKCFYYMFTSAVDVPLQDLVKVSQILVTPEFSHSLKETFQTYVLKLAQTLIHKLEDLEEEIPTTRNVDKVKDLEKNLYIITVKTVALSVVSDNHNDFKNKGKKMLEKIAMRQSTTVAMLHERFFVYALDYVHNLDSSVITDLDEPIVLLDGLIRHAMFRVPYLEKLQSKIKMVFDNCADEAKIKVFSAISMAMLNWHDTINRDVDESVRILRAFLAAIVEDHLQWRAGVTAEAMRTLATTTLCSLSEGARAEAVQVLPSFADYIPTLLEDHSTSTRQYAVRCLYNFGELEIEKIKPIAYATLQRLDDPSGSIREIAIGVIPKLRPKFLHQRGDEEGAFEYKIWETFIRKAVDMLFLYYDGPGIRICNAIKESILELGLKYPEICKDSYLRTTAMLYDGTTLNELRDELPFMQ